MPTAPAARTWSRRSTRHPAEGPASRSEHGLFYAFRTAELSSRRASLSGSGTGWGRALPAFRDDALGHDRRRANQARSGRRPPRVAQAVAARGACAAFFLVARPSELPGAPRPGPDARAIRWAQIVDRGRK